jgi:hypothetical protein
MFLLSRSWSSVSEKASRTNVKKNFVMLKKITYSKRQRAEGRRQKGKD